MQIKVLFDKDALDKKLRTGWGVSFLIDDKVLFDTGEKGKWLLENMKQLKVDPHKIETVVVSHDHWDHTGGLWEILQQNHNIKIYSCPNFGRRFKNEVKLYGNPLIEFNKFTQISQDIYTTGEIEARYAFRYMSEQALVLRTPSGLTILTGCAHPGIVNMIENIKKNISADIYLVLGGFHLITSRKKAIRNVIDNFKQLGVKIVAPTHCTGDGAIDLFRQAYKDDFIEVKVGQNIKV